MLVQPFDNNPFATEVKTGSYNILADEYALVTAEVQNGGTFSIDAAVALSSLGNAFKASSLVNDGSANGATVFTMPGDRSGRVRVYTLGVNNVEVGIDHEAEGTAGSREQLIIGAGSGFFEAILGELDRIYARTTGADKIYVAGFFDDGKSGEIVGEFWVPSSTALTLTGDTRYTVQRYKVVT